MTFGYMLLTAAFVLCVCVASNAVEDKSNVRGVVGLAAGLILLGTLLLGVSEHWHNQDYHNEPAIELEEAP